MQRGRRDSVAFTVVVGILVLLGGLAMALVVGLSGAPGSLALAAVLAALPVGPLVGCFMWLDRYEPEPRRLLVAGLLWGAFVATAAALVFQGIGASSAAPASATASRSSRRSPRRPPRAPSSCCCCGGGATSSTASSTASSTPAWSASASRSPRTSSTSPRPTTAPTASAPAASTALTGTFILRCLISPFAHPLFTAFIGIGVGLAIAVAPPGVRVLAPARRLRRRRPAARAVERLDPVAAPATSSSSTAR